MKNGDAEFVTSAADAATLPDDGLPHVAFVGRSNVGKSSLINALLGARLARTSATPGKTRLINLYRARVAPHRRLDVVDLPGYGYAKGAEDGEFERLVSAYCEARERTAAATLCLLLVDARHPGLDADRRAWQWLADRPFGAAVVATKIDKLTRAERVSHLRQVGTLFRAPVSAVSAERREGVDDLWQLIRNRLLP